MIKVKDGYAKLIGTTYQGSATRVLLSNGGDLEYSASSKASTLVQRNASQHIYATYFNSAISDEALTDIGSVYVRNTSDTFIRRVSKTQFYSILDDKFVTLDTTQSITGAKTFSTSVRFANNASIIQNQNDTSNYTTILKWYKNGASRNTYDPSIGQHNTGGDGNGSICILPYPTKTSPWGGTVGLFISKGVLKLDGKSVALAENYYTKTESDERYVNVTGDTMTGPLIVKAAITGTQLISTIATGTSPLKVTSTTVVTNLNSDLLDGLHETSFFRARGDQSIASSVPTTTELATSNNLCGSWNVKYTGASGHLVQFNAGSGSTTRYMQFYSMYSGSLYWRNSTYSTLNTKSWKTIVDSANYTGIVLKIGTATKGSATLPIYLNAGTPTACSTTLGVSITGNAATATKLQTARTINGTSFDGTANIVTAYWGTARTISLSGAVTGSASVNGSQNVTITTTYQFGSIDGRYVGGNKTANHGSSRTAYTADTYSSTFVNKAFVAFAERGSWAYANNGYVSTDTGVNIPLAGTAIFQWGASDTNKTQLYITPHNNSGVSNPAANEMLFYTSNGSGYTSAWTRVLTNRNYTIYTVTKTGGGASGTWGISITGNAATANRIISHSISDTLANKTTPGYLYHAGGSNSVKDKPSGVDAFGVFTMQTASGWYGQILMSSNTSTGLYWRTATTLSGGWKKILDSSNYTAYINPANFVTALGTSGNYLTWTKNGVVNNLTVPYATASSRINSSSSVQNTGLTYYSSGGFVVGGTAAGGQWGMPSDSQDAAYKNGQCLRMYWGSTYYTDILSGPNNMGTTHGLYMRQIVNGAVATGTFAGGWRLILDSYNYHRYGDTRYVTSLGTNGTYVTWVKNGTTNNLTVPYSSYSGYLQSHDTRSTNNTPAQFSSGARFEFKYNSTDGLSNGGTYHGILHFKPYGGTTDFSGGQTHQLGFTDGGNLYMRTSTSSSAWGSWKLILTQTTADGRYVTSLGTNGNYLTWTKAGTTNNLTVPFATTSNVLNNLGNRTAISGTTVGQRGLRLYEVYNNGYPVNFGNVLNIGGQGYGELLFQWTGDSNPGHLYYRSKRNVASQAWSNWVTILDNNNYSSTLDGRYVTLATNQTVSGIKTFSTQQKFTVATGTSPFTVSSTTVVSNLNADMLDGWHLNYILKDGYVTSVTAGLSSYWRKVWDITLNNQYNDVDINLLVHSAYNQQWGIISFRLRQNGTGTAKNISAYLAEVVGNIPTDRFRLYYNNSSGLCQLWCNPSSQYSVYNYRVLAKTWRTGTEATTLGTFYTGNTTTAQSLPSDSYVSMTGITIVNTAAKVANTLTFAAGAFAAKTYNGSAAVTVNIPTHTSHLTNNSGFWTGTRYWANIAVSTASSTSTQPTFNTCYTSNWFRSTGRTGWYSQTYGGGWYMADSTWIRTFGSKSVYQDTGQIRTDGYLVTYGGITVGATSPNNGTYKSHVTGNSWSSGYIRAGAGFYHNSVNSNSYVLLAGGSYKSLADFAKGNAGASNRGVYVTNGTVTAMTYYLNATVNSGASGKLAYYSGTNSIDDYTNTIGSSSTPIYINDGIPNAANSYEVVNSGHYFSAFGISGYIYVIRYGQVVCVSINMSSGGNGSTGTTTLLTNLPSAVYTTGQSASKGGGAALRYATFYVSGTTLYVYSYQADSLPNRVSFTYITNAL